MRLMQFTAKSGYHPGNYYVADALIHQPLKVMEKAVLEQDVKGCIQGVKEHWPASDKKLREIANAKNYVSQFASMCSYVRNGWPEY